MFYTFVLKCKKTGRLYIGYTNDLRKRFGEHNSGKSVYTNQRGPYDIIYYEACLDEKDTKRREKYLKTAMRKRYIHNRLKRFLSLMG